MAAINIEELPVFQNMHPIKRKVILDFLENVQGKPIAQALPALFAAKQQLTSHGLSFTRQESELMVDALSGNLSEDERQKLAMVRGIMG